MIGLAALTAGCATNVTDAQASAVVKKCIERRYCGAGNVGLRALELVKREESSGGLQTLTDAWNFRGSVSFKSAPPSPPGKSRPQACAETFDARVSFARLSEDASPHYSFDPVAFVSVEPSPAAAGAARESASCYYFLVSGNLAEK